MTQTLNSLPLNYSPGILCIYSNHRNQVIIVRISNIPEWYFERVVFPGEQLLFEALPEAYLEIYRGDQNKAILAENFPCSKLQTS